jgi:hypothetical protein
MCGVAARGEAGCGSMLLVAHHVTDGRRCRVIRGLIEATVPSSSFRWKTSSPRRFLKGVEGSARYGFLEQSLRAEGILNARSNP